MSNKTKIWLITATSLVLIGGIIFAGAMTVLKWDFRKLSTVKYETNSYEINEEFNNISVNIDTADITFVSSEDEKTSVVCYEEKNEKHAVTVKDGTLAIEVVNTKKWYEYVGVNFGSPKITVYIPKGEYGALSIKTDTGDIKIPKEYKFESINISGSTADVTNYASVSSNIKIKLSTGDIYIKNISANTMNLTVSTGKVVAKEVNCKGNVNVKVSTGDTELSGVTCKNIISSGNTGDIYLKNVVAEEKLSIKRSTGDVIFKKSDANELFVKTDTGDVKGSLLTEKVFIAKTDTGRVDLPKTVTGGRCEITTDTGDISITVEKK